MSSAARAGHGEEHDRCLAALELVDRADLDPAGGRIGAEVTAQEPDLVVVGRDDHHVAVVIGR